MKKLVFISLMAVLVAGCCKDDDPKSKKLDPMAQLCINVKSTLSRAEYADQHLSPKELLEKAERFQYWTADDTDRPGTRSIGDNEKDFDRLIIKMWGDDIINHDTIATYWRDARDLIITTGMGDTIGYIPQHVRNAAFEKIFEAEKQQNYELIYQLFQKAFEAVPCTPEEYKELKAKGLN